MKLDGEREVCRYKSVCYLCLREDGLRSHKQSNISVVFWSFTVLKVLPLYKSNHR